MKPHFGFLSFCLLLSALLLSSPLRAAFKIDVHINGADNPTLTFGEDDALVRSPHPPFSGMFGVVDVCFAGPKDEWYNGRDEVIRKWYDYLAEDIKIQNDTNQWILVAKSNARLTFNFQEGNNPPDLYIVYKDVKDPTKPVEPVLVEDGKSFSVKTGGVYTITRNAEGDPAVDPNAASNQFVAKGETGEIIIAPEDFTPKTMHIIFSSGIGKLAYDGEDLTARELTLADIDWIIKVVYDGDVAYEWTKPYTELKVTLGNGTRGDNDPKVTMIPNSSSAPPVQTTITTRGDGDTPPEITNIIDWILQKFGTLDFDGDGVITGDDVMYLYNWVNLGMPRSDNPDDEWFTADMLGGFIANPDPEKLNSAWEYFQANTDELIFDGSDSLNADNVMYLYNYVNLGCPSANNPDDEWFTADMLGGFIADPDPEKLQTAMDTLQDYAEQ